MTASSISNGPDAVSINDLSLRVLVVDPHAVNQQLWLHLVRQLGHRVQAVHDGGEALEVLAQFAFDVVLMDIDSPEVEGFTTAGAIRARARDLERPWIVGCTAAVTDADTDRAMSSGFNDLMVKSGRRDDIEHVLEDATRALGGVRGRGKAA